MTTDFTLKRQKAEKHGRRSELFAAAFLMLKGYRILGRRVKTKVGEIDLVARAPSGLVCFIEVKARADGATAIGSVGPRQQMRIAQAASLYLAARPNLRRRGVRYDVVTVSPGSLPRHIRDAFRSA
jgi:putative endonuclease